MHQNNNRILFTTDLSEQSRIVFEKAVTLALKTGATIDILHVIESGPTQTFNMLTDLMGKENYKRMKEEIETSARNTLIGKRKEVPLIREALKKLSPTAYDQIDSKDSKVVIDNIEVRQGHVAEVILNSALESNVDMIIMGYYPKSMIMKAVLGSTVKSVLKDSKIPVYLVPLPV